LQLSTLELNQELEKYLLENPLLEREDEDGYGSPNLPPPDMSDGGVDSRESGSSGDAGDTPDNREQKSDSAEADESRYNTDDEGWPGDGSYASSTSGNNNRGSDDDDNDYQDIQAAVTSLSDHLIWQLGLTQLPDRDRMLVRVLIEALDEDGYLSQTLEELAEIMPEELDIEPEELQIALKHLQHFEPTGVGARNAQECLSLQLETLVAEPVRDLALIVVRQHLELLAARDFVRIKKLTGCDDDALRASQTLIKSLNPRPGAQYAPLDARYIIPDVIVKKIRHHWQATVNPDAYPRLRINRLYAQVLAGQRGSGMSGQLQEARWLIKNVQQRFDTIQRVSQTIVDRQRQFFEHGEVAMRPLVLREIADILGLHESTVSRVTTQKYMATPRGIFELKYFFGSHVATDTGGACSATAIRALIKQLVGAEDPKKPLSDSQIAEILGQQGIVVARRTIAKYREALNISPVNLRKSL
jgi:RNA polymerase sigma-54 factor